MPHISLTNDATAEMAERIYKLFRLAEQQGGPGQREAESAAAKAQALLLKYGLTEEQVRRAAGESSKAVIVDYTVSWADAATAQPWARELHAGVAEGYYCEALWEQDRAHFIGRKVNAEVGGYVLHQLINRFMALSVAAFKEHAQEYKSQYGKSLYTSRRNVAAYRGNFINNWLRGAAQAIRDRLSREREAIETAQGEAAQFALMVINENERAMDHFYPNRRRTKTRTIRAHEQAYLDGYSVGADTQIREGLAVNTSAQLPS